MRTIVKLLSASALVLALGGCVTTGANVIPAPTPQPNPVIGLLPDNVQSAVLSACHVAISTEVAQQIISVWVPQVDTWGKFIRSLCAGFNVPARSYGNGVVVARFRGITMTGQRVRVRTI